MNDRSVFTLTNEFPNVFPQTKLPWTNKWLNDFLIWLDDLFKYSNIFDTLFSHKYGDSSDSGEFGDFCNDGKTVDSGESKDSCEYGDSSKYGNSGEYGNSG